MRAKSYVKYLVGEPEELEKRINEECKYNNVRIVSITNISSAQNYFVNLLVAFERREENK